VLRKILYIVFGSFMVGWVLGLSLNLNESHRTNPKEEAINSINSLSTSSCQLVPHLDNVMRRVSSVKSPEQLNQKQRCDIIDYANDMYLALKDETQDDQIMIYQHLLSRREALIDQPPTVHLSEMKTTLALGDASSASIHQLNIFLKPTCGKCAKFYLKFLSHQEEFNRNLTEAKMFLNINIRPYQSAAGWYQDALPSSPQAQVDQELAAMWFKLLSSKRLPNSEQFKRWYLIVQDHRVDMRYLRDPVVVFREIFDPNMILSKSEIQALTLTLLNDVKALPKEAQDAPSAVIDGRVWYSLKDFHLSPVNLMTVLSGLDPIAP
jgi:hypothetical protein